MPSHILMIRPVNFAFNSQTAVNNAFQVAGANAHVQNKALREFDDFVNTLKANSVEVTVINDTPEPHTPDSVFPNNWISFHENRKIVLYPMFAPNRRLERKPQALEKIKEKFAVESIVDLSSYELQQKYLEGTGSMVLDRDHWIAYACLSPRTNLELLSKFCEAMKFKPVVFNAVDARGRSIYHTNVMMCVADSFVVICLDAIPDPGEKAHVEQTIKATGKELIPIEFNQMNHFAGNMLQVTNNKGEKILVMSTQAFESLNAEQLKKLIAFNRIIHSPLNTIETNGGGSARCMMAEVFT